MDTGFDLWKTTREEAFNLGDKFRTLRVQADKSLADVVLEVDGTGTLGLDTPTLSRLERGQIIPGHNLSLALSHWLLDHDQEFEPRARTQDPDTSHEAADSVKDWTIEGVRLWWLNHLACYTNAMGRTALWHCTDEGARIIHKTHQPRTSSDSGFRTRRSELVKMGLVEDTGRRTQNESGRNTIVWGITGAGMDRLKKELG